MANKEIWGGKETEPKKAVEDKLVDVSDMFQTELNYNYGDIPS